MNNYFSVFAVVCVDFRCFLPVFCSDVNELRRREYFDERGIVIGI